MKPTEPVSPGLAARGPNRKTVPALEAFSKASTPSFIHRKGTREAGTRKISKPITSCNATPHAKVFSETFRRSVESNQAIPANVKKPAAETK